MYFALSVACVIGCAGGRRAADDSATTAAAAAGDPSGGEFRDATPEPLDHWTKLGERVLAEDGRKDSIRASVDAGRFSSVRFVIKFGKLELSKVKITFDDGTTFSGAKRMPFGDGVLSRAIDLPGDKRVIRQIDFEYGGVRGGRSTQIEIWAQ